MYGFLGGYCIHCLADSWYKDWKVLVLWVFQLVQVLRRRKKNVIIRIIELKKSMSIEEEVQTSLNSLKFLWIVELSIKLPSIDFEIRILETNRGFPHYSCSLLGCRESVSTKLFLWCARSSSILITSEISPLALFSESAKMKR